jgi:RNA polymerase sigma factor (sigma-70 family)
LEGFLHTTVRNFCIDTLRKKGRRQELLEVWLRWTGQADQASRESEADHKVIFAELTYCIQSTIDRMPRRYQEAYRLYILENKTAKEAGKVLGISDQTVREDVSRVLEQINTELLRRGLHITLMIWALKMLS